MNINTVGNTAIRTVVVITGRAGCPQAPYTWAACLKLPQLSLLPGTVRRFAGYSYAIPGLETGGFNQSR